MCVPVGQVQVCDIMGDANFTAPTVTAEERVFPSPGKQPTVFLVVKFLFGQLGRTGDRRRSIDMLLTVEDLPGAGWTQLSQRSSRSIPSVRSERRRKRHVSALRKFRQEEPARGLHIQLLVFDSDEEAQRAVGRFRTDYVRYPGLTTVTERVVDDIVVEGLDGTYAWERENIRGEVRGYARSIAGQVGPVAIVVIGSATGEGWRWDDLISVARHQVWKVTHPTS